MAARRSELTPEAEQLKRAIDTNDVAGVQALMTRHPDLHQAALGYGQNGPLTWVAECRVPWEPPGSARLSMAEWMILHGSDVHQGHDGPLMRAALNGCRIPMMELLVAHGADVNARWNGDFPIIFAPCETLEPAALKWLLDHGADPNCSGHPVTALDYLIAGYVRSPDRLSACIELLLQAGARTRYNIPAVMAILRGRLADLEELLDADRELLTRTFPELDCGESGGRCLQLKGGTLLHVAVEYANVAAAKLLLDRGAGVNAPATVDEAGIGGQTAIYHAVTKLDDTGLPVTRLLLDRGADVGLRVRIPGSYERPGEIVECTPLEYALLFGDEGKEGLVALLRESGAKE